MKKTILITVVVLVVLYIIYLLRKKGTTLTAGVIIDPNANLTPDPTNAPTSTAPLFTDSGNGALAIATRMMQLKQGGEYIRQAGKLPPGAIFDGMQKPALFQQRMGGIASIPFPLTDKALLAVNDGINASREGDRNGVQQTIQNINRQFIDNGLPPFLPEQFYGGGNKPFYKDYICPNYGDCPSNYDLSRNNARFPDAARNMVDDIKILCSNIVEINNELNLACRNQAINDLVAAGWKFVGYTQ